MKQLNQKVVKGLSVAMLLMGANLAIAEVVSIPASVTVNNAIDLTFTGTLDFGEVRATADTTNELCSGLTLGTSSLALTTPAAAAPFSTACTGPGTSALQSVGGTVARPSITIAGAAPFTTLDVILPTTANLTAPGAAGAPIFQLIGFTALKTSGTSAPVATNIQTDGSGGAVFTVGATLITDPGIPAILSYQDQAYEGTFDVTVEYP